MRIAALSLAGALCLGASASAVNAAPSMPSPIGRGEMNIVHVAGGCGWGFHRNRWHRCAPNRYGDYRARPYWRGYYGGGYYGGGYWQDQNGLTPRDHFVGGY